MRSGVPKPQMVDKYTDVEGRQEWTFTLRPGLKFSDGKAVTAADCVASLQRWSSARLDRPGDDGGRRRMEGGRREHLHADA